jgi:hypothetical protein
MRLHATTSVRILFDMVFDSFQVRKNIRVLPKERREQISK